MLGSVETTDTLRCPCGQRPWNRGGCSVSTPEGLPLCEACANGRELDALHREKRVMAYLTTATIEHGWDYTSGKPRYTTPGFLLTTWIGGKLATVQGTPTRTKLRTPTGGIYERWYGQATDVHGKRWSFTSPGPGMYARMRRMGE